MTRLLASVVDPAEMELAIAAGVDIVDLKNPHTGALGALPLPLIRELAAQCAGRCPVSATVGDLPPDPLRLVRAVERTAGCGVDFVKAGFFSERRLSESLDALGELTAKHAVVAVLFADRQPPLSRLGDFAAAGFRGVMLDTAGKGGGGLTIHMTPPELTRFVAEARDLDLFCGLAGSLRREDIPALLPLTPDYLGFRGALCRRGERQSAISPTRLQEIRDAIPEEPPSMNATDSKHRPRRRNPDHEPRPGG